MSVPTKKQKTKGGEIINGTTLLLYAREVQTPSSVTYLVSCTMQPTACATAKSSPLVLLPVILYARLNI